jgi:OPA family glycerol-3-phosphate transporter-like MFS transporter
LRDRPSHAGFADIDTGVAVADQMQPGERPTPILQLFKSVFSSRVLVTVTLIGICTGALRDGLMHWAQIYAKAPHARGGLALADNHPFVLYWGLMLMCAGIVGPMTGGWARDKLFQSRCGPPAGLFYGMLILCTIGMTFCLPYPYLLGGVSFLMAASYIGSQGLLTATAAMDFGGKAKATATGVIDGFVYIGTAMQSVSIGYITTHTTNWVYWPLFLIPFSVIGFLLCLRIWKATAEKKAVQPASAH